MMMMKMMVINGTMRFLLLDDDVDDDVDDGDDDVDDDGNKWSGMIRFLGDDDDGITFLRRR